MLRVALLFDTDFNEIFRAMQDEVAYATAKAGLCGFVRALAVDAGSSGTRQSHESHVDLFTIGTQGITANCVAPGWIGTESSSEHERSQGAATPMRRCGTPLEVASCVQWLASESASYITGQTVIPRFAEKESCTLCFDPVAADRHRWRQQYCGGEKRAVRVSKGLLANWHW
jgi:NAD(P)-dependent dehydrogenase (short-subunit alcohol dehydrogenase family)